MTGLLLRTSGKCELVDLTQPFWGTVNDPLPSVRQGEDEP